MNADGYGFAEKTRSQEVCPSYPHCEGLSNARSLIQKCPVSAHFVSVISVQKASTASAKLSNLPFSLTVGLQIHSMLHAVGDTFIFYSTSLFP